MARTLPRTPRTRRQRSSRAVALVCALAVATGPALYAAADDLDNKHKKAQSGVKHAQADLEDSSHALYAAMTKLRGARTQLGEAQRTLARTEGELTVARVLDARMQAKLARAEKALDEAQAELDRGRAQVVEQRRAIGRLVASNVAAGDPRLLGFSMLMDAASPDDLAAQLNTIDSVMDKQSATYDDYKATEALLKVTEKRVAAWKGVVAEQRQAAAVNLARKRTLEQRAVENRARVVELVRARKSLALVAARARAADARKLRAAKKEEERIKKLILKRASHHKGGYKGDTGGFLRRPVDGYITSPFGWRRHPIYGYWGLHNGTDFHAPCGTPELAGAAGTVISEYYSDVWGNRLLLDVGRVNGKAMTLIYNHISSYKVGTGARVGRGDVVAYSGTTGWSTACHLHFTVMLDGTAVNPENYF